MGQKKERFCVNFNGAEKLLYSIEERNSGDLTIFIKNAYEVTTETVKNLNFGNKSIPTQDQKYSIHPSIHSPDKNIIKQTLSLIDKRQIITRYATKAIKGKNLWAPIYLRRYPNISDEYYDVPNKNTKKITSLGLLPTESTLIHGIYVTNKDTIFPQIDLPDISVIEYETHFYKLLNFFTVMKHHPNKLGRISHIGLPNKKEADYNDQELALISYLGEGFNHEQCLDLFIERREFFKCQFFTEIKSIFGINNYKKFNPKFEKLSNNPFKSESKAV